jgi:hypothetical protein
MSYLFFLSAKPVFLGKQLSRFYSKSSLIASLRAFRASDSYRIGAIHDCYLHQTSKNTTALKKPAGI